MLTLFRTHQSKNLMHILFIYLFLETQFCSVTLLSLELTTVLTRLALNLQPSLSLWLLNKGDCVHHHAWPNVYFFKRQVPFSDLWDKDIETQKKGKSKGNPCLSPTACGRAEIRLWGYPVLALSPDHRGMLLLSDSYRDCFMLLGHLRKLILKASERNPDAQFRWGILLFSPSWNVSIQQQ